VPNFINESESRFVPQMLEGRGRVAIFIDAANLFYAASHLEIEIDYIKLLRYLTTDARLLRSFFYTGVDRGNDKQHGFLLWMSHNGYRVISKEIAHLPNGETKANLDVEIAIDMLTLAESYDTAVLLSGDGDFTYALNAVSYRGKRVEVVGLRSMTHDRLIDVADRYVDLDEIKKKIQKCRQRSAVGHCETVQRTIDNPKAQIDLLPSQINLGRN
jgi:uncharacterized LabA/DUF88 family protein